MSSSTPIRYAVVGLGHIAQVAVLPAFAHARRNSKLVAVVSDDRTKRREMTQALPPRARLLLRTVRRLPARGRRGVYRAAELDARGIHRAGGEGGRPRAVREADGGHRRGSAGR